MPLPVRLRPVEEGDLEAFFRHQADPAAVAMGGYTPRDLPALLAHWGRLLADPACNPRTILLGDAVAGQVSAWTQDGERHVGYVLGQEHWGRGIATQALALFLEVEPARPLVAEAAEHNAGSLRVLDKCGFVRVGSLEPDEHGTTYVRLVHD